MPFCSAIFVAYFIAYFGDYNHKGKANRAGVGCGVMDAVVDEVGGGETELDETVDVIRSERSA